MLAYAWARVVNRAYISKGGKGRFINHFDQLRAALRFDGLGKVLAVLRLLHLRPKLTGLAVL